MINENELSKYVNEAFTEELIRVCENHLLLIMKTRQEKYPSEKNDNEWFSYTKFVCRRRYQSYIKE